MDSLDSPFTIEINGHPIAKVGDDTEDRTQAKTGSEAAIFTLKDKHLQCGDLILGRSVTEDRSFLPKQVLWFKNSEENHKKVQPVTAQEKGESYQLKFTSTLYRRTIHFQFDYANSSKDAGLIEEDGNVLAELGGGKLALLQLRPMTKIPQMTTQRSFSSRSDSSTKKME